MRLRSVRQVCNADKSGSEDTPNGQLLLSRAEDTVVPMPLANGYDRSHGQDAPLQLPPHNDARKGGHRVNSGHQLRLDHDHAIFCKRSADHRDHGSDRTLGASSKAPPLLAIHPVPVQQGAMPCRRCACRFTLSFVSRTPAPVLRYSSEPLSSLRKNASHPLSAGYPASCCRKPRARVLLLSKLCAAHAATTGELPAPVKRWRRRRRGPS